MGVRPTISDIAARAGLSKGAVSYALNGLPGVSDDTRERVQQIAAELGWIPNRAAVSLSRSRAGAVGLVLARSPRTLALEPFYMEFIAGIETVISRRSTSLMLRLVANSAEEIETYNQWWSERRVDGVIVVDVTANDARLLALDENRMPAVVVTSAADTAGLPHVWTDDASTMELALAELLALGHTRIARVAGMQQLAHTAIRTRAFRRVLAKHGLDNSLVITTDFSGEDGARATHAFLDAQERPTAIIYDNDIMAVAGIAVAAERGVSIPGQLSLLAWDDSPLCEITLPQLSAMHRDVSALGENAAELLLRVIEGDSVASITATMPDFLVRGSTATAP